MTAKQIIDRYIDFFEKQHHVRIHNAPLIPENDPTTLFTSSGMQPLVPYLLGETHPSGKRLVNVQNAFRAVDIDEIGNNRHTTFFRMLGNWSLGDYFKKEQLPWLFSFLTKGLGLDPQKLFVTIFKGGDGITKDEESLTIWKELFSTVGIDAKENQRIFAYDVEKNWWSRSGIPSKMPTGEPGGPDSEVFYDFGEELQIHEKSSYKDKACHVNCDCGRYIEICNSVFMQYRKEVDGTLSLLPKPNVDFGGGLERFLLAIENQPDVFQTNLFAPIITMIAKQTNTSYKDNQTSMRIITDHFTASSFIILAGIKPSNKEQGYILRRLLRRGFDHYSTLGGTDITPVVETIVTQYGETDPLLKENFEEVKNSIIEEQQKYAKTQHEAKKFIEKKTKDLSINVSDEITTKDSGQARMTGKKASDELLGVKEISADDAFTLYTTHGLSPTQIKSLGYTFDDQAFAEKMEAHQKLSRAGASKKFAGGLADHSEKTIMGHTATHLMHQALRDVLGNHVHQTGSNITAERVRFDFNYDKKLTDDQIKKVETIVTEKIQENLPVHFEMMPLQKAKELGAIGLFDDKYAETVKIYFIGGPTPHMDTASSYSIEFCGGPHVDFTRKVKSFRIIKQENLGQTQKRLYAHVG